MSKAKCKYCNEEINKEDKLVLFKETKRGKSIKINIHKKCESNYNELMQFKENELYWMNQIYEQIKELLGYSKEQRLPNSLITRIQDLRNGTVMKKDYGRIVKSKEGYRFEIIFDCLLSNGDNIRWAMKNNTFAKESNRINYLMAIVENNINDSYNLFVSRERLKENRVNNEIIEEESKIIVPKFKKCTTPKKESGGIAKFLDEDDF